MPWVNKIKKNSGGGRNMKAIDEKGRVFGKLNLIDLVVVLVLIALGLAWRGNWWAEKSPTRWPPTTL